MDPHGWASHAQVQRDHLLDDVAPEPGAAVLLWELRFDLVCASRYFLVTQKPENVYRPQGTAENGQMQVIIVYDLERRGESTGLGAPTELLYRLCIRRHARSTVDIHIYPILADNNEPHPTSIKLDLSHRPWQSIYHRVIMADKIFDLNWVLDPVLLTLRFLRNDRHKFRNLIHLFEDGICIQRLIELIENTAHRLV